MRDSFEEHHEPVQRRTEDLYVIILIDKIDVADATAVGGDKLFVTGRSFVAAVGGKHALEAHADALDCLDWGPAGGAQEIKADDAIAVDVGVHRNRAGSIGRGGTFDELDLRRLWKDCVSLERI